MTTVRDRINAHLPIVLEVLRTGSLVVIALSTICASQSLKQMAGGHDAPSEVSATHRGITEAKTEQLFIDSDRANIKVMLIRRPSL